MYKYTPLLCQIVSGLFEPISVRIMVPLNTAFTASCMYIREKVAYAATASKPRILRRIRHGFTTAREEDRPSQRGEGCGQGAYRWWGYPGRGTQPESIRDFPRVRYSRKRRQSSGHCDDLAEGSYRRCSEMGLLPCHCA